MPKIRQTSLVEGKIHKLKVTLLVLYKFGHYLIASAPLGLSTQKGMKKTFFKRKIIFWLIWDRLFILKANKSENCPKKCGYSRKKMIFAKFFIVNAALQNENILGSNNRTKTVDMVIKSVDECFEKSNIQGPIEYSTSPEST